MKVKYANKVYEVLYTKEVVGKTMYAVEDEPNHIDWLVNVEVINEEEESEDEETRKEIIGFLRRKFENSCSPTPSKNTLVNWIDWLEKQDEQKDIEPKFKIGDWVVTDKGDTIQIKTINNGYYTINNEMYFDISYVDKCWHKWNIANAKDGDVLWHVDSASNGIFIFKEIRDDGKVLCYCDYDSEDHFCLGDHHTCCWSDSKYVKPATKEQRNLLFARMKEAGYEWDANKKELKKIEVEPENYKQQLMSETLDLVKDYIQQKSAWTEDDEKKKTLLIKILEANHPHGLFKVNSSETMRTEELVSWLKSLNL